MLILDEKKIRKGKAVGLPYVGSKKKISKKIVEIIKQNFGTDKTVYDVFGGGGAITAELMINEIDVVYNDLDKTITDMFCAVLVEDREWIKTLMISRDEFMAIKNKEHKSVDDELKLLVNSFGNNRKDYLYAKDIADAKYKLAKEIVAKHDVFSGYKQTETYKNNIQNYSQLEQLTRLQQLERLQQASRLQQLEVNNQDYRAYSDLKDNILYLDPPYENATNKYKNQSFNSNEFYDWAFEMSKNNIVLLSSYEVSDPRFEVVYEFKTARSTLNDAGYGKRYEKLFMVRK